jgi:hypothetical protein
MVGADRRTRIGERIRTHLRSNVVGYAAVFIALSGVAYAGGLKKNSVKSKQIKDGQVLTQDIGDGAVGTADLADGAVATPKLADAAVTGGKLAGDAVDASKVGANALGGADIDEASLTGIDAATLGGTAPSGFALAGHNHDSTYVNEGQADSVNTAMIANTTRTIQVPLRSLVECDTDAGADINFASGADAFPDFVGRATDGEGFFLRFDADTGNEDQDTSVCSQVMIPADAVSPGLTLNVRLAKNAHNGAPENLNCTFAVNGGPISASNVLATVTAAETLYPCASNPSFAPNDLVSISLSISSSGTIGNEVDVHGLSVSYQAIS